MAESWRILFVISASCRRDVTAKRFDGTRKGKMQASSEGRKHEAIRPTGLTGLPMPFTHESVGLQALRLKLSEPGPSLPSTLRRTDAYRPSSSSNRAQGGWDSKASPARTSAHPLLASFLSC